MSEPLDKRLLLLGFVLGVGWIAVAASVLTQTIAAYFKP